MPFIASTDICDWLSLHQNFPECPEALAVRELKSKDRIEVSTFSSIKLRFQIG